MTTLSAELLEQVRLGVFDRLVEKDVLDWAFTQLGNNVALATSFSLEDMVVLDMIQAVKPRAAVFTLDTGRLHQETYLVMDQVRSRYGIDVEVYCPDGTELEALMRAKGPNSFYDSVAARQECCHIRKVEPLSRALAYRDGWVTGRRAQQAVTRLSLPTVEVDEAHGSILKINPIVHWSLEQVWAYIKEQKLPYNRLYDHGYQSIGCAPCTRAILPGENERSGRWWWENPEQKECGIHVQPRSGSGLPGNAKT